jgi:hypothetical protein
MRRTRALLGSTIVLALLAGCSSDPGDGEGKNANTGGTSGNTSGGSGGKGGSGATGSGGTSGSSGSSGASGSGGSSGVSGSSGSAGSAGAPIDSCPTAEILPTVVRRLTRFEYANTVGDLLNVDTAPVAALPRDEVSNGFDNESSTLTVSSLHAEKYVLVSEELAKAAVANLATLTKCDAATTGEDACAEAFAKSFGRRAFRRPTTPADEAALMTAYEAGKINGGHARGIEVMIRAALQSPNFIFRLELTPPTDSVAALVPLSQFELATRLSYMIWGTGPSEALLDTAQAGQLGTKEVVAAKAREMLLDPKARLGLSNFFEQWSGVTRLSLLTKNTTMFPNFSEDMRTAMMKELPAFIEDVMFNGDHSLRSLLTQPTAFVSGPLGQLYGLAGSPTGATPTAVNLGDSQGRSGLLTQAGFLAVQGHPDQTSPVLRGKFVRAMMLCQPPKPPPDDVDTNLPAIDQGGTARERFSAHADAPSCRGCHIAMDPIGFAFENFDAMGQHRTMDNGQVIDASGEIFDPVDPGLGGAFVGVRELGEKLAASPQVMDCMATQWFRYSSGRLDAAVDGCSLTNIREAFNASNGDVIELIVAMTQADTFFYRAPVIP